ncbi:MULTISPECIES: molybdenum cofactor guanylyltransferase [Micrococcaceae]|uniref:Molybdopterin-guanine dinucleotide biosynthesis protein A n=1 Tax=Pseudarthrobacter siccitolerans TaxID=861266 RepID=A0ABU0PPP2_9MICC|nr:MULTISPECIES: NTP transferase domain-containing protein [Micrococcaceae]MDQ0675901.1 molybdopterin-guanine dinucleotide biosynthesis protein A [Pseudarthrobacter siccitolerans]MDQ0692351.1 molybdopterin-guanine dinucleotide biosynthesis protein A [Arthrobacter sp. W4I7]
MEQNRLDFDALVLAGGRSSRLGGVPKQGLVFEGATLLQRSLAACSAASLTAVVGPDPGPLPAGVVACREEPEFAGPAAAVAAGLEALGRAGGGRDFTLVLACDMPRVTGAVQALAESLALAGYAGDGVMACSEDGTAQMLVGFYRTDGLKRAVQELASRGRLIDGSMRSLLASLDLQLVTVPAGTTADVDTWDDAAALGVDAGKPDVRQDRRGSS